MPEKSSNHDATKKIKNVTSSSSTSSGSQDTVTKNVDDKVAMDVYSHGCKNAINPYISKIEKNLEKHAYDYQGQFYDRLSEKNSFLSRLNHGIDCIPKKFESHIG